MAVRAKFVCQQVAEVRNYYGQQEPSGAVKLHPVYSSDENSENRKFWASTPNGSIALEILNPEATRYFEAGAEYYVTFERVPKPDPTP